MGISDCVLIVSTLFLGLIAIIAPYYSKRFNRWKYSPNLSVDINLGPPDCHKTYWSGAIPDYMRPVYYFRFVIRNNGKTICNNVENSLENIWKLNIAREFIKIENFTPINLKWSINFTQNQQNINPGRKLYCNIGHLPTNEYQKLKMKLINPIGYKGEDLRIVLDLVTVLNVQLNCLPPGSYIIQVNTYSENHKTIETYFKIDWSGNWKDNEKEIFQELVINKTYKPK
jgi:hypothetical protein